MHIGSTDGTTGPVPVRGCQTRSIQMECQNRRRLYRLGLAGSTAVGKITAVVPEVLPGYYRPGRAKLAVLQLQLEFCLRLYRLDLAGSTGPVGIAWFLSRWLNTSGCTTGAPVQPALRGNLPNGWNLRSI